MTITPDELTQWKAALEETRGKPWSFMVFGRIALPRAIAEIEMLRHTIHTKVPALETAMVMLQDHNVELIKAIRKHRDQRGDDRCWRDDEELYAALPEGYTPPARDTTVELENCKRFIESRQNPKTEYVSPEREIERLRNENQRLRATLKIKSDMSIEYPDGQP